MITAAETMAALCGETAPAIGSDGADAADFDQPRGLLFNKSLTALRLAGNQLEQKAVEPLLGALASNFGTLRSVTWTITRTYFALNAYMHVGTWT